MSHTAEPRLSPWKAWFAFMWEKLVSPMITVTPSCRMIVGALPWGVRPN